MIDLQHVVGFDWDDGNRDKIVQKHQVSCKEAEQVFINLPLLLLDDLSHSETENRYHAYGKTSADRLLQIAFTMRQNGTLIRVVSARPMSMKERTRYDEET